MFIGVRRRPLTHQWSLTSSGLDPFATFNYGLLREMSQVSLDLVVFLGRQRCTHALSGNSSGVNCSFYFKIGACRHGDRCSRLHNKPTFSQTIVLLNLYRNPQNTAQTADGSHCHVSDVEVQEHYDNFFEEVFTELQEKYGEIEEMNVCDNLGDHLVGNVYVKFRREEDAERAVAELNNRWFNGQAVHAELSPVTDFRESCCRQYEMGECTRGGFCNFMHLRPISRNLRRQLYGRGPRRRSPPRSHTGHRPRERNRRRSPDHRHGRF
ncbi:splicing factor U2AF 26 kDa subunit isoform X4 [Pontoporia blainvillei]|uniref:Splicing factor U2AF 26 kDa subunit isoform X4 n=1 Tax=Pontoporia blainvillei TaxID=48723 RepID=A0ABX0S621_PONBL|nr:splicing factor U2AF 26 kDa subunit isoform X4 [Pontoporia blainvillei]